MPETFLPIGVLTIAWNKGLFPINPVGRPWSANARAALCA